MSVFKPVGSNTTYPHYSNLGLIEFTNPIYGAALNQNPSFTGTPDNIHNGTDNAYWTATNLNKSQWTFNSTAQAKTGTRSIDGTSTTNQASMLLTRTAGTINTGDYESLSGWIYVTRWDDAQNGTRDIRITLRNGGVTVGQTVGLLSIIEPNTLNTWQQFVILSADLTSTAADVDEIVIEAIDSGAGAPPDFYLDDLAWQEAGGSITFNSNVPQGFSVRLEQFSITFVRAHTTALEWDKILGKTLNNGIILQAWTPFGSANLGVFRRHVDFMFPPGMRYFTGGDGTNRWITYEYDFTTPLTLSGDVNGQFRAIVQDNLSDFLFIQAGARGEIVETEKLGI